MSPGAAWLFIGELPVLEPDSSIPALKIGCEGSLICVVFSGVDKLEYFKCIGIFC
jgi:hypothetical protein